MTRHKTELFVNATLKNLPVVQKAVSDAARAAGYTEDCLLRIELVVEEAYLNVVHHAYRDQGGEVVVICSRHPDSDLFQVTIIDHAPPFAVSLTPAALHDEPFEVRQPGGCGMTLIRSMTRSAIWQREDDRNMLTMLFDPSSATGGRI